MRGMIKVPRASKDVMVRLGQFGYAVDDGKKTKCVVAALRANDVDLFHGYDQEAKKVMIAIGDGIKLEPWRTTAKNAFFRLKR